jgi:mono/diheme cytochrome c family protein
MKITIVLAILAALAAARVLKANLFTWILVIWGAFFVAIKWGFTVPIPASVVGIYMSVTSIALFTYVTSDRGRLREFLGPLFRLMTEKRYTAVLALIVLAIPTLVAANVYRKMNAPVEAPFFSRTVHPAPPADITVHDKKIDLLAGDNPYRGLETSNPAEFKVHLQNGRRVYFENCVFCHGDDMSANGMFAHALNPIPTNFMDHGTIPMLQESFLFWRISKGGPGLPEEGGPWESAMPAWENFLSEDEIWDVILFLYDFSGSRPRARESHEEHK